MDDDMDYDYVENNFHTKPIKGGEAELVSVGFIADNTTVVKIAIKTNELYSEIAERNADLWVQPTDTTIDEILKYDGDFFAEKGPFSRGMRGEKRHVRGSFTDKFRWVPPIDLAPPPLETPPQEPFLLTTDQAGDNPSPVQGNGYRVTGKLTGYTDGDGDLEGQIVTGRLVLFIAL